MTTKTMYPALFDKRVYEYYYDFCYIYERLSDSFLEAIENQDEEEFVENGFYSEGYYSLVDCLSNYIIRINKTGTKKQKDLIAERDFFNLIDNEIWERICDDAEDWLSGVDHPYEDMMSDCFTEIFTIKINDIGESKEYCNGCANQIKCSVETKGKKAT